VYTKLKAKINVGMMNNQLILNFNLPLRAARTRNVINRRVVKRGYEIPMYPWKKK
jgi:hypothetical protein